MNFPDIVKMIKDNGGCRSGAERRRFSFSECIPERRSGKDRRKGFDRRSCLGRRMGHEHRQNHNHRDSNAIERRELFRGI